MFFVQEVKSLLGRPQISFVGDDVLFYEAVMLRMVQRDSAAGGVPGGTFRYGKASYHICDTRPE